MSKQEWQKLLRISKNENEYHKLTICVRGYIKENLKGSTVVDFYVRYPSKEVKIWYKDVRVFRHFRNILNE